MALPMLNRHQATEKFVWPIARTDPEVQDFITNFERIDLVVKHSGYLTGAKVLRFGDTLEDSVATLVLTVPEGQPTELRQEDEDEIKHLTKLPIEVLGSRPYRQGVKELYLKSGLNSRRTMGTGTGGLILTNANNDLFLLTNHHVIDNGVAAIHEDRGSIATFSPSTHRIEQEVQRLKKRAEAAQSKAESFKKEGKIVQSTKAAADGARLRTESVKLSSLRDNEASKVGHVACSSGLKTYPISTSTSTPASSAISPHTSVSKNTISSRNPTGRFSSVYTEGENDDPMRDGIITSFDEMEPEAEEKDEDSPGEINSSDDWALIRLDPNTCDLDAAVAYNTWEMPCLEWEEYDSSLRPTLTLSTLNTDPETHLDQRTVMKLGCVTGYTTGKVNGLISSVRLPLNGRMTHEFTVIGDGYYFSQGGDSGSGVVDEDGLVVGLLLGGELILRGGRDVLLTYYEPIERVISEASRITGWQLFLPTL